MFYLVRCYLLNNLNGQYIWPVDCLYAVSTVNFFDMSLGYNNFPLIWSGVFHTIVSGLLDPKVDIDNLTSEYGPGTIFYIVIRNLTKHIIIHTPTLMHPSFSGPSSKL